MAIVLGRPFGEDEDDAARLLDFAVTCRNYRALPRAGGVLDQSARLIYILQVVEAAYQELEARKK